MTRRSRSQALIIWEQIANGLLFEPGRGAPGEMPTKEYYDAIHFLTKVAAEIIQADQSSPQQRPRSILKALQLDGKHNADETALQKTLEILDDFADAEKKVSVETKSNLARGLINSSAHPNGRKRSAENRSNIELVRQLRELNNRIKQDKK